MPQVTLGPAIPTTSTMAGASTGGAHQRTIVGAFSVPAAFLDEIGDIILFPPLPAGSVLNEVAFANDDLGASHVATIGFCDGAGESVAAGESRDAINTAELWSVAGNLAQKLASASVDGKAWATAGFAADPGRPLYPCVRTTTAATAPLAGNVIYRIRYAYDS